MKEEEDEGIIMTSKMVGGTWKGKVIIKLLLLGISSENGMVVDDELLGCATSSSLFSSAIGWAIYQQRKAWHIFFAIFFSLYIYVLRSCFCAPNSEGSVPLNSTTCYYKRYKNRQKGREREG